MKLGLSLWREDAQKWAFSGIEIDDQMIEKAPDRPAFIIEQLMPFLKSMEELQYYD